MDKNLVSIDNLIRQRLGGEDGKVKEGAWMQMRDLLDKEMPQTKPFVFDWRRACIYAGVTLLVSSIGIGGYNLCNRTSLFNKNKAINAPANAVVAMGINETNTKSAPENGTDEHSNAPIAVKGTAKAGHIDANNKPKNTKFASGIYTQENKKPDNNAIANNKTAHTYTNPNVSTANNTGNNNDNQTNGIAKNSTIANKHLNHNNVLASAIPTLPTAKNTGVAIAKPTQPNNAGNSLSNTHSDNGIVANNNNTITIAETGKKHSTNKKHLIASTSLATNHANLPKGNSHKNVKKTLNGATNELADNNNQSTTTKPDSIKVDKLVGHKRFVHDMYSTGHFTFDTISREELYEQLHSITKIAETRNEEKNNLLENAVASNTTAGGSNTGNANELLPASSLSTAPSLKSALDNKPSVVAKKADGSKVLENLSATFNDIKLNAKGMQFTKGITAGANSAFFGPTSFYGFHFGVTGSFNFGDNVAVVTELKYFHRINTNYQMNDDFYIYESNTGAGGGYKKSKIDYDFSFSTLQSIEMPIAVKYTICNFSFFAGGNFLYTFGINTGAVPLPDPTSAAQIVATKGKDDHATLSYGDFGQRFGMGYLFGLAFKVSPSVSFDLRTVQTVWDNAKTDGAKAVSNTLYKSPSLQLSLNYRLGAPTKNTAE